MSAYEFIDHTYDVLVVGAAVRPARDLGPCGSSLSTACITKLFPTRSHTWPPRRHQRRLGNMGEDDWRWHMYDTVKGLPTGVGDQDAISSCAGGARRGHRVGTLRLPFSRPSRAVFTKRPFGGMTTHLGKALRSDLCRR